MATVYGQFALLQETNTTLEYGFGILQATANRVQEALPWIHAHSRVEAGFGILQETARTVQAVMPVVYDSVPQTREDWLASSYRQVPSLTVTIQNRTTLATKTLTHAAHLSYSRHLDESCKWTLKLRDRDRDLAPFNTSSSYYGWLRPYASFTAGQTINLVWQFRINVPGDSWESPWLVAMEYSYDASPDDGYEVTISGIDMMRLLLLENQSMASMRSSGSYVIRCKDVVQAILSAYNLSSDLRGLDANPGTTTVTNYPIRDFDFQSQKPIEALARALRITGCHYRFRRHNVFEVYPRAYGSVTPAWSFVDQENCAVLNFKDCATSFFNRIEVRRTLATGTLLAEDEKEGEAGFQVISWDEAAVNLRVRAECRMGTIYDPTFPMTFFNGVQQVTSAGPANELHFVFKTAIPDISAFGTQRNPGAWGRTYWHVWVYGDKPIQDPAFSAMFDNEFSVTVTNSDSWNNDGAFPAPEPEEDELIPDDDYAERVGKQMIQDSLGNKLSLALATPGNPWIEPGEPVSVRETWGGFDDTNPGLWIVKSHTFELSPEECWSTLELARHVPITVP